MYNQPFHKHWPLKLLSIQIIIISLWELIVWLGVWCTPSSFLSLLSVGVCECCELLYRSHWGPVQVIYISWSKHAQPLTLLSWVRCGKNAWSMNRKWGSELDSPPLCSLYFFSALVKSLSSPWSTAKFSCPFVTERCFFFFFFYLKEWTTSVTFHNWPCLRVPADAPVPVSWIGFNSRLIPALFLQGFPAVWIRLYE